MAFLPIAPPSALPHHYGYQAHAPLLRRRPSAPPVHPTARRRPIISSQTPSPPPSPTDLPALPSSLPAALALASTSLTAALPNATRLFVDIDVTNGDATYTTLKNTLPMAQHLHAVLRGAVILPDAGAAALARRDWQAPLFGIEQVDMIPESLQSSPYLIVCPRASETNRLVDLVTTAPPEQTMVVLNPDLVDMGVTGLSLNARRLRGSLIDSFQMAYYLRTYNWGVLHYLYGEKWDVYVDDADEVSGFRLVARENEKPFGDRLDDILNAADPDAPGEGVGGVVRAFSRFINALKR